MITIEAVVLREEADFTGMDARVLFEMQKQAYPGLTVVLLDSGEAYIGGVKALWHKYEIQRPELATSMGRKYYFGRGNVLFTLSGATSSGNKQFYDRYEPLLETCLRSFHFIESGRAQSDSVPHPSPSLKRVMVSPGDSFWVALAKAYGETFAMVLVTGVIIALVRRFVLSKKV